MERPAEKDLISDRVLTPLPGFAEIVRIAPKQPGAIKPLPFSEQQLLMERLAWLDLMSTKPGITNAQSETLRVLIVEDSEPDTLLLLHALQKGGFQTVHQRVASSREMRAALARECWDLILADHAMPDFSAPAALALAKRAGRDIPFIIVSGHIEEDMAVAAMQAGAHDYIMKDRLARLVPAVSRELREAAVRRAGKKSEEDLLRAREELEMRVESRTAELESTNLKLHNLLEERKKLEDELLEIAENERRRIGFDLHDDLGQKLAAVSLMAKGIEQRLEAEQHPFTSVAQKLQALLEEIVQHTHNLARDFASLDIHGDNLPDALNELAASVGRMFSISCTFGLKGELPVLPRHTSVQLYKICQEALSNAIKHGKASHVSIVLHRTDAALRLMIANDGAPFFRPPHRSRMGLRIMNFRSNTIGATLNIESKKAGSVVTCTLPVLENSRPDNRSSTKRAKPDCRNSGRARRSIAAVP